MGIGGPLGRKEQEKGVSPNKVQNLLASPPDDGLKQKGIRKRARPGGEARVGGSRGVLPRKDRFNKFM